MNVVAGSLATNGQGLAFVAAIVNVKLGTKVQ